MKHPFVQFIIFLAIIAGGCKHETTQQSEKTGSTPPKMEFEELYYDFGTLTEGEKVTYSFRYKNTGGSALIIKDAVASCGCTVPDYERKPLKPGEKGEVEVVFDSNGMRGHQYKSIILKTNTPYGEKTLTVKANVISNKN